MFRAIKKRHRNGTRSWRFGVTNVATRQATSDEILSEIEIAAAPERVFQALIDPAQVVA